MPIAIERKLRATAKKKHFGKKRTNRYIYGSLRKMGWKPKKRH